MTGEHNKERAKAIRRAEEHGWSVANVNPKTGYTKMHCGCGVHSKMLHKTPRFSSTFRRNADWMIRTCSTKNAQADEQTT